MLKKLLLLLLSAFVAFSLQANASIISFDVDYSTIHTGVNTGTDLGMGSGVFIDSTGEFTWSQSSTSDITNAVFGRAVFLLGYQFSLDIDSLTVDFQRTNCERVVGSFPAGCANIAESGQFGLVSLDLVGTFPVAAARVVIRNPGTEFEITEASTWTFTQSGSTSEVPIPAAAWLFGTALLGLAGLKRK
jgi:hypothetical protein